MTDLPPGMQALAEAARFETARIYGRTLDQANAAADDPLEQMRADRDRHLAGVEAQRELEQYRRDQLIRHLRDVEGLSMSRIALRVGVSRTTVHNVLAEAS